jgi:hypothetical protein
MAVVVVVGDKGWWRVLMVWLEDVGSGGGGSSREKTDNRSASP